MGELFLFVGIWVGILVPSSFLPFFFGPLTERHGRGVLVLLCFDGLLAYLSVANLVLVVILDPGKHPKNTSGDCENPSATAHPVIPSLTYVEVEVRDVPVTCGYCTTCKFVRPARTSHCTACGHCIESKDHHCPWLLGCIGRRNIRHFFSFLVFVTAHCLVGGSICLLYIFGDTEDFQWWPQGIMSIIGIIVSLCAIITGNLLLTYIRLGFRGITMKENYNRNVGSKTMDVRNPYHEGSCARNILIMLFEPIRPSLLLEAKKKTSRNSISPFSEEM